MSLWKTLAIAWSKKKLELSLLRKICKYIHSSTLNISQILTARHGKTQRLKKPGKYSNTLQTCGSKLAKFSDWRFLSLFFTSKLAVPLLSTQVCDFCYFLSPKILEFGGITVNTISGVLSRDDFFTRMFNYTDLGWIQKISEIIRIFQNG